MSLCVLSISHYFREILYSFLNLYRLLLFPLQNKREKIINYPLNVCLFASKSWLSKDYELDTGNLFAYKELLHSVFGRLHFPMVPSLNNSFYRRAVNHIFQSTETYFLIFLFSKTQRNRVSS